MPRNKITQPAAAEAKSDQESPQFDAALDWLINWAMAVDMDAQAHFFHICDDEADECGCKFQGDTGR